MIQIYSDKISRILKNKKILEKKLNVKITNKGKDVLIEGKSEDEYVAEKVIEALNFGFVLKEALLILEEDFILEIIPIKNFTKRNNLSRIRARIIGKQGKTKNTLCQLTKCSIQIKENEVAILGDAEYIKNAQQSIISLIRGSKQANVYSFLEKHQPKPVLDLGLKIKER